MHLYEGECPPAKLIKGSIASPSLISSIIVKKFLLHLPLYRQELEMQRKKMPINRKNMSNWLNKAYTMYFRSIYDTMYHDILNQDLLHMDETSVTVLEDRKNGTNSKSYMWIMASNRWEENQIRYFSSFSNREYQNAQILLGDSYKGGIHCDVYDAYHKLVNVIIYGCWVHARRYFIQAFDLLKETSKWNNKSAQEKETFAKTNLPYQHLNYIIQKIDELFHYEKKYKLDSLSIENIYKLRQKEQKPIIDDLFTNISKISGKYTSQSKMGSAINYIINQKEYLINYLNNGKADISNNLAENAIRPFAVGRKNWLFSKTRRGSECSAAYFSIIETCKANSIDPELYFTHVMERCRGKEPNKVDYKTLLPYSKELPEYIRTKNTDKK